MLKSLLALTSLASLLPLVLSQASTSYTDSGITFQGLQEPIHNVTYGFVLPPTSSTTESTEFIGEIIASAANKWVGLALGGQMANNLLIVAWPNENDIVFTPRFATGYLQPTPYSGPTITTLSSSVESDGSWKWIFRCQECTTWTGGSLNTTGTPVMAWVISNEAVLTPSSASSNFNEHDDFGFWGENLADAHSDDYDSYLTL